MNHELWFVGDGEELLDFLKRRGQYERMQGQPLPGLLILDINMPRKDGMQALQEIKEDSELQEIPVLMLTSSNRDEDMIRAYTLDVSGYINKTGSFGSLIEIMKAIGE